MPSNSSTMKKKPKKAAQADKVKKTVQPKLKAISKKGLVKDRAEISFIEPVLRSIKSGPELKGQRVLLRVDFNVPLNEFGQVEEEGYFKLRQALPTLEYLIKQKARVIIMTHLGRPQGRFNTRWQLHRVARVLKNLLGQDIFLINQTIGPLAQLAADNLKDGQVMMLENLRFYEGELKNSQKFAAGLAELADVYINDAFGVSHRTHASVQAITDLLPSYAGLLLSKEVSTLSQILKKPQKPLLLIIGGIKFVTKIKVIENLLPLADKVLLGSGMAANILKAHKYEVGQSLADKATFAESRKILKDKFKDKVMMPVDLVAGKSGNVHVVKVGKKKKICEPDELLGDIGPVTADKYAQEIKAAKTIIWNGPLGFFEQECFQANSGHIALAIAKSSAKTIAGGGETLKLIHEMKLENNISNLITGGGAMLEFLQGLSLPGLEPLKQK